MFDVEKTRAIAFELIKKLEGLKLEAYPDSGGKWTIGYGSTIYKSVAIEKCLRISKYEAEILALEHIDNDIKNLLKWCNKNSVSLKTNEAATILSFIYNAGFSSFIKSSMAREIKIGDFASAAECFELWNKIRINEKLTFSAGLFNRRMKEKKCFVNIEDC